MVRDVKAELESNLSILSGKGKGVRKPRGPERKKMWDEVRELRKEWVLSTSLFDTFNLTNIAHGQDSDGENAVL